MGEAVSRSIGRTASQRQLRVGEEIRHALASVLARGDLRDPELIGRSVTVTEVRPSPDLRNATAYVVPFIGGGGESLVAALTRAAPYLQRRVGQMVRLKFVPHLSFQLDDAFDNAERISGLLNEAGVGSGRDTDGED